jgi:hypothetical protein
VSGIVSSAATPGTWFTTRPLRPAALVVLTHVPATPALPVSWLNSVRRMTARPTHWRNQGTASVATVLERRVRSPSPVSGQMVYYRVIEQTNQGRDQSYAVWSPDPSTVRCLPRSSQYGQERGQLPKRRCSMQIITIFGRDMASGRCRCNWRQTVLILDTGQYPRLVRRAGGASCLSQGSGERGGSRRRGRQGSPR